MSQLICGVTPAQSRMAAQQRCQWDRGYEIKWAVESYVPGLDQDEQERLHTESYEEWMSVCGVLFKRVRMQDRPNIIIRHRKIDGPQGVLAQHYMPCGKPNPETVLPHEIDESESWSTQKSPPRGQISFYHVVRHETGHGLGSPHIEDPEVVAVMNPYYNVALAVLQPGDIQEGLIRYGEAKVAPDEPGTDDAACELTKCLKSLGIVDSRSERAIGIARQRITEECVKLIFGSLFPKSVGVRIPPAVVEAVQDLSNPVNAALVREFIEHPEAYQ